MRADIGRATRERKPRLALQSFPSAIQIAVIRLERYRVWTIEKITNSLEIHRTIRQTSFPAAAALLATVDSGNERAKRCLFSVADPGQNAANRYKRILAAVYRLSAPSIAKNFDAKRGADPRAEDIKKLNCRGCRKRNKRGKRGLISTWFTRTHFATRKRITFCTDYFAVTLIMRRHVG